MNSNIRLSRITHPRATLWAMILIVTVFLGFGVFADANSDLTHQSAEQTPVSLPAFVATAER